MDRLVVTMVVAAITGVAVGAMPIVVITSRYRYFLPRSDSVTAVVTGIRQERVNPFGPRGHVARVGFRTAEGRPVTTEVLLPGPPTVRVGQALPFRYDPANPSRAKVAGRPRNPAAMPIALGAAIALIILVVITVAALIVMSRT